MGVERSQIAMSTVFLGETKQCHDAPKMSTKTSSKNGIPCPWTRGRDEPVRIRAGMQSGYAGRIDKEQEPTTEPEPRQGSRS